MKLKYRIKEYSPEGKLIRTRPMTAKEIQNHLDGADGPLSWYKAKHGTVTVCSRTLSEAESLPILKEIKQQLEQAGHKARIVREPV